MCMCDKPNVNGEPGYKWPGDPQTIRRPMPPEIHEGDEVFYDLPGRCGRGVDSHCHHFTIVINANRYILRVRNGCGDDAYIIGFVSSQSRSYSSYHRCALIDSISNANSDDDRYWIAQNLYHAFWSIRSAAVLKEESEWKRAAREGRLKLRSRKGQKYAEILPEIRTETVQ